MYLKKIDRRQCKQRRIGEIGGRKDWKQARHSIIVISILLGMAAGACWLSFLYGQNQANTRWAEKMVQAERVAEVEAMNFYGSGRYFMTAKHQVYYVHDRRDLDNEKKWIRARYNLSVFIKEMRRHE